MSLSEMNKIVRELASDICEDEKRRETINSVGPTVIGGVAAGLGGPGVGMAAEGGAKLLTAVNEKESAQFMTELALTTGISVASVAAAPVVVGCLVYEGVKALLDWLDI